MVSAKTSLPEPALPVMSTEMALARRAARSRRRASSPDRAAPRLHPADDSTANGRRCGRRTARLHHDQRRTGAHEVAWSSSTRRRPPRAAAPLLAAPRSALPNCLPDLRGTAESRWRCPGPRPRCWPCWLEQQVVARDRLIIDPERSLSMPRPTRIEPLSGKG